MRKTLLMLVLALMSYSASFANIDIDTWRWRKNNGDQRSASWAAPTNSAFVISDDKAIRLRVKLNGGQGAADFTPVLSYSTDPRGPFTVITDGSPINAFIMAGDNTLITNKTPTTQELTQASDNFFPGLVYTKTTNETLTVPPRSVTEVEWVIKPTANIMADTTYYFSADNGETSALPPMALKTSADFPNSNSVFNFVQNGGFESLYSNWEFKVDWANGSTAVGRASYNSSGHRSGLIGLEIEVTEPGPVNSVTLVQRLHPLEPGTYLLRFWAAADTRNALLNIELSNDHQQENYGFQIYDRFETPPYGWQRYQYAFKVDQKDSLDLRFHFNSSALYYLDDIEIINETIHPGLDIETQYNWQSNFNEAYGFLAGENGNPILLPDSSIAWLFNNAYIGTGNPGSNVLAADRKIDNMIVHQVGDEFHSIYRGTAGNGEELFTVGTGNTFWQAGAVIENGDLKVLLLEMADGAFVGNTWVGRLSLPDFSFKSLHRLPTVTPIGPSSIMTDDDYHYLYFGQRFGGAVYLNFDVARVPVGQLDSNDPWEFLQDDGTWSTDLPAPFETRSNDVAISTVLKLSEGNYVMSGVDQGTRKLAVWFSDQPTGPWMNRTVIDSVDVQEKIDFYNAHINPLSRNGSYSFTYSVSPSASLGDTEVELMQQAVKSSYFPVFAKGSLFDYSPFSPEFPEKTLLEFTASYDDEDEIVTLNWTSPDTTDLYYEVEHSVDGENWTVLSTVNGADSVTSARYTAVDASPADGGNYYRIAVYDEDYKLRYSVPRLINTEGGLDINLTAFTAVVQHSHSVLLQWETASEKDNKLFQIERSTDGRYFKTIGELPGAGTSSLAHSYRFVDASAPSGVNYYRLSYLVDGRIVHSEIRSVELKSGAQILLQATPNPTSEAIQFQLKGYDKSNFYGSVFDLTGKLVEKSLFQLQPDGRYRFNQKLAAGVYILQVAGEGLNKSIKVLVK